MTVLRGRKWLLLVGIVLVAGVGWFVSGAAFSRGSSTPEEKVPEVKEVPVTCLAATPRPVERAIEVVGTLEGYEEVNLGAKVEGRVARIPRAKRKKVAARVNRSVNTTMISAQLPLPISIKTPPARPRILTAPGIGSPIGTPGSDKSSASLP